MKKITWNFIVDCAAFISFLGLVATGCILEYVLPPGSGGRGWRGGAGGEERLRSFWSLGRHDWGELHFWFGVALVVLVVIHIVLHWDWIKMYFKNHLFKKK